MAIMSCWSCSVNDDANPVRATFGAEGTPPCPAVDRVVITDGEPVVVLREVATGEIQLREASPIGDVLRWGSSSAETAESAT